MRRPLTTPPAPRCVATLLAVAAALTAGLAAAGDTPSPRSPADRSASAYPFPHFTWAEHPDAFKNVARPVSYEIQVATDATFSTIVDEDTVSLNRYVHDQPLSTGTYAWRVRAIPYKADPTAWSAAHSFLITACGEQVEVAPPSGQQDHTAAIKAAIARTAEFADQGRSVKVVFPPGDYTIGDSLRGPLIDLDQADNILLEGTGARLHFTSRKQGFIRATRCENIAVMGFACTFRRGALRVQGHVDAIDKAEKQVTVSIQPGYPGFDASSNTGHDIFYLLEPGTEGRLKSDTRNFFRAESEIKKNADSTWSFTPNDIDAWDVGDRFGYNFRSGSSHLVDFSESRSTTAYGLKAGGWGGMGYVSIEGSLYNILNCTTVLEEGKWMTGVADGIHIRGHVVGPWIEGVHLQAIGDDSVALYARPASIQTPRAKGNPKAAYCRPEFFNLDPGDEVSFFQPTEGAILLETEVTSVEPRDDGYVFVTFADELPRAIKNDGPLVENTQIWNRSKSCGDFVVHGSHFKNIRRYGTVFRSKRGVVENNTYEGISARGIVFINGTAWPNGLYASEIIVRNNRIVDSCFDHPSGPAAISFLFNGHKRVATTIGPRNLLIEGNTIEGCPSPEIDLSWVKNARVRNNLRKLANGRLGSANLADRDSEQVVQSKRSR